MATEIIPEKTCTACNIPQPITNYHKERRGKYGVFAVCKKCRADRQRQPEQQAAHYRRNLAYKKRHGEKLKEREREYCRANRDRHIARARAWALAHPERVKARSRLYYQSHKAAITAAAAAWQKANPAKVKVYGYGIRARKRGAVGGFTLEQWIAKCDFWGWRCYICRCPLVGRDLTIDHRKAISRGGTNWIANVAPACNRCNAGKFNRPEKEYRTKKGHGNLTKSTVLC